MVYYSNEEIKIRSIIQEDLIYLFTWWIDKETNKNDPRPLPNGTTELFQECKWYCERFENEIINEKMYKYFIITNNDDYPIGFVNFFGVDKENSEGELGVVIGDKRYLNKGIAYLAVSEVIKYFLSNTNIKRVRVEISENNIISKKLFNKLGFKECGEYLEEEFNCKFIIMESILLRSCDN